MDSIRPACCTEHLLEMATLMHGLLEREGIKHWADYGTLLGAVREGDLIAWDEDVDFGALEVDADRILALGPELEAAGHVFERHDRDVLRLSYSAVNKANLDIFLWREDGDALKGSFDPSYDWPGSEGQRFPKSYVEELEPVRVGKLALSAPSPIDGFLIHHRYGPDYMQPARPILRVWLCPEIPPDAMTPRVKAMLAEMSELDHRLSDLATRTRFAHTRLSRLWQAEAIPLSPPRRAKARLLSTIPADERNPIVDHLAGSIAFLEQAVREFGHPTPVSRLRQLGRFAYRRLYATADRMRPGRKPRPSPS